MSFRYQKVWRDYVKFRHLLANMPKPSFEDKRKLETKEIRLQKMRTKNELKRNVTVTVSSEHFNRTGIMCDIVQVSIITELVYTHLYHPPSFFTYSKLPLNHMGLGVRLDASQAIASVFVLRKHSYAI